MSTLPDNATARLQAPALPTVMASPWLPEVAIILVATLTRFWRLVYHSIWFDEAVSVHWATSDPGYTWRTTFELVQDKHPPLYYITLHFWRELLQLLNLSNSDGGLRAWGALLGILTVWGIMCLASRLSDRPTGLLAGLLTALSPILIWYSQELRMFQPATTAIIWAAVGIACAWTEEHLPRRMLWWTLFALTLLAAQYTYLFSAFIFPSAGLTLLLLLMTQRNWRRFAEGALALAIVTLLYLPLAQNAWLVNTTEGSPGQPFQDFWANTIHLLQVFTAWRVDWSSSVLNGILLAFAIFMLLGMLLPFRHRRITPRHIGRAIDQGWLILWVALPFLIANALLGRSRSIFAEDRYLIFMVPFVLWACARGVMALASWQRLLGWIAGSVLAIALLLALPALWTPTLARENWRAAAQYILDYEQHSPALSSAVVTHVDYTHEPLEWYLRQEKDFEELPLYFPFGGPIAPEQVEEVIAPPMLGIVDTGAATLWFTQSHLAGVDDERRVETWLNSTFPVLTELYPNGIKMGGYMLQYRFPHLPQLADTAHYPNVEVVPGLTLATCEVVTPSISAQDDQMHPPSGWVHLRLWWQANVPIVGKYTSTAQVVGPEGVWGDALYRDRSVFAHHPTDQWQPDETIRDELDINMNPLTPAGEYPVVVGVLDENRTPTDVDVQCGTVQIE